MSPTPLHVFALSLMRGPGAIISAVVGTSLLLLLFIALHRWVQWRRLTSQADATELGETICACYPKPDLWAVATFVLNYIPSIGSLVASLVVAALGLFQVSLAGWALLVALLLVNQSVWGNVLEPLLMGKELDLSPLAQLLGLAYWDAVWGVVGMVLSVPILVAIKSVAEHVVGWQPLAALLSDS